MKTKYILAASAFVLLGACDESEYELENLVPEQYHKVLYINNSGTIDMILYNTGEDNTCKLSIFKGGSQSEQTADAIIGVLEQDVVDKTYSEPEMINYKVLAPECYSIETTELHFSSEDRFKNVTVAIHVPEVEKTIARNPGAICVLPLYLYSRTDSVNEYKNETFIKISEVLTPTLGFMSTGIDYQTYTVGFDMETAKIEFGLDTDNSWDIDCMFDVDPDFVAGYNAEHGTSFVVLPEKNYSFEKEITLSKEKKSIDLPVTINGNRLQPVDYLLPVRVVDVSLFGISETTNIYLLAIRVIGNQFDRSNWSITTNTEEKTGEGANNGVATCLLDGNINSFWHSQWSGGSVNLPHELTVDVKETVTFSHFGLMERQHASYKDVKAGEFYVSSDNTNWTLVGKFEAKQVYENQVFPVTPTKGRYFKIRITESNREQNSSLAEIYAYGTK